MDIDRSDDSQAYVRQVVMPLKASPWRKRTMREELEAHFWAVYREERANERDAHAATEAAESRLGNAVELRRELQAAVPGWEQLVFGVLFRKENGMVRMLALAGVLAVLLGMAVVMPAMAKLEGLGMADQMVALMVGSVVTTVGLGAVGLGVWRWRNQAVSPGARVSE